MPSSSTSARILETARQLFNRRGYAATTQAAIAAAAGLTQGNLTYHFPAKRDLALALLDLARSEIQERDRAYVPGDVCADYVRHVAFSMDLVWRYRFLLRDRAQLVGPGIEPGASPEMVADLARLDSLIHRFADAGLLRRGLGVDLDVLTRSLWIVSRYWLDHLDEFDHVDDVTWGHFERGIAQHRAMLDPCLTATGQRRLDDAFRALTQERRAS
ncbi:MAG: TetR family transcriptional regulator [Actinomycetota bacterium]